MEENVTPVVEQTTQSNGGSGFAIASMILGILSVISCCLWWVSVLFAVVGLILAIIAIVKKKDGKAFAIAGLVLAIVALIMTALFTAGVLASIPLLDEIMKNLPDAVKNMPQ